MGDLTFDISIPIDSDGFLEMECDYCRARFMLHHDTYESEENINFFCPICGLPNRSNTFFVPEVIEKAQQLAMNYMLDEIDRTLGSSIKKINKYGFVQMELKSPKRAIEKELYVPSEDYSKCSKMCCNIIVKVKSIDKETGTYCPICGKGEY